MEYKMPDDPGFFSLHVSTIPTKKIIKKSIVSHLLNAVKSCIPLHWKRQLPPTIASWLCKIENINKMEDLILTAQHKHKKIFQDYWEL